MSAVPSSEHGVCCTTQADRPAACWRSLVLAATLAAGCGDDAGARTVSLGDTPPLDAAVVMPGDATLALPATQLEAGATSDCAGDELIFALPASASRTFAAAVVGNEVHLLYLATGCDGVGLPNDPRGLRHAHFASTGPLLADEALAQPVCSSVRRPVLLADQGSVLGFFVTRGEQAAELQGIKLLGGGATITPVMLPTLESELSAVQLGATAAPSVLYTQPDDVLSLDAGASILALQRGGAAPLLSAHASSSPSALATTALSDDGGLVLWVDPRSANAGVYLRAIDAQGQGRGEVRTLSGAVGSRSAVAAAARTDGALVVYSEAPGGDDVHRLQLRLFDTQGLAGEARTLTGLDEDVGQLAVAAYRNGYAVAYQRLGGELNHTASIRLRFVDRNGQLGATRLVAPTTVSGSALSVLMASDGRLIVIWDALDELGTEPDAGDAPRASRLHVARLTCL